MPRNCSNDWVAVTRYFDEVMTDGTDRQIEILKGLIVAAEFGKNTTEDLDQFSVTDLAGYLKDPLGDFQVFFVDSNTNASINLTARTTDSLRFWRSAISWRLGTEPVPLTLRAWPLISTSRLLWRHS